MVVGSEPYGDPVAKLEEPKREGMTGRLALTSARFWPSVSFFSGVCVCVEPDLKFRKGGIGSTFFTSRASL